MWITEFVHTGVLENNEESKKIYRNNMSIATMGAAVLLPLIGKLVDRISARIIFPLAFLTRSLLIS